MGEGTPEPLDERALADLIRRDTAQLFGVVRAFTEDDGDAEDLLQQLWIIAADRAHRRDPRMPLGAWLHRVALNLGRTHHRRGARRRWLRLRWTTELPHLAIDPPASPVDERAPVWRAVAALPSLQRDVVLLRVVDGLSTREAADRLGRAEGTVKASLHRALATLRRHLSDRRTHDDRE